MRIDSGGAEPFDFRCRRRPTTNFTRPRTRSSNPPPSSEESCELSVPERPSRKFAGRGRRYPHKYHHDPRRNADAQEHCGRSRCCATAAAMPRKTMGI
jgi:hypothetical protein